MTAQASPPHAGGWLLTVDPRICMHQTLFRLFLAPVLTAFTALAVAQALDVPAAHPLVGVWRSAMLAAPAAAASGAAAAAGKPVACTETMDYRVNHIRLGTSGKEITRATYDVAAKPSADGFYRLTQTVLESNGQPDCAGDLHSKADDTLVRFIQFSPQKDQFIVCQSASLGACFGPFRRQVN